MRTLAAALLTVLLLAGCGEDDEAAAPAPARLADLRVTVDPDGDGPKPAAQARVRCDAPEDSQVCRAVSRLSAADFEPVPEDSVCTLQYGGPDRARVTGTLGGERIDARFARRNGCEIGHWERVAPLLDAAG